MSLRQQKNWGLFFIRCKTKNTQLYSNEPDKKRGKSKNKMQKSEKWWARTWTTTTHRIYMCKPWIILHNKSAHFFAMLLENNNIILNLFLLLFFLFKLEFADLILTWVDNDRHHAILKCLIFFSFFLFVASVVFCLLTAK